jgi:hypothetical protein
MKKSVRRVGVSGNGGVDNGGKSCTVGYMVSHLVCWCGRHSISSPKEKKEEKKIG